MYASVYSADVLQVEKKSYHCPVAEEYHKLYIWIGLPVVKNPNSLLNIFIILQNGTTSAGGRGLTPALSLHGSGHNIVTCLSLHMQGDVSLFRLLENRTSKLLHTQHCSSLGPHEYSHQV